MSKLKFLNILHKFTTNVHTSVLRGTHCSTVMVTVKMKPHQSSNAKFSKMLCDKLLNTVIWRKRRGGEGREGGSRGGEGRREGGRKKRGGEGEGRGGGEEGQRGREGRRGEERGRGEQ